MLFYKCRCREIKMVAKLPFVLQITYLHLPPILVRLYCITYSYLIKIIIAWQKLKDANGGVLCTSFKYNRPEERLQE